MNNRSHSGLRWLLLVMGLGLVGVILWSWPAQADIELPPRHPSPTPTRVEHNHADKPDKPTGAFIEFYVQPISAGLWAAVQWQDTASGWHEVEGWRGTLDEHGGQRWWVAAKDFNTGPFRWVVSRGAGQPSLATSLPFNLPRQANEVVRIEVALIE